MALIICPDCKTSVSSEAKNCLKCGRSMIYWTPGRILIGVLMVVAVFGVPSYCLRVTVTPTYTPTTTFTQTNSYPEFQSTTPKSYNFKLGDAVNIGDKRIKIFGFQSYSDSSMKTYYNTSQGIAMDVLIENIGDTPFWLSPLQFTVQDSEGRALVYYDVIPGGKSPALHSEKVAPGQKIRAFITYADTKKPFVIYYKSLENQIITFTIEPQDTSAVISNSTSNTSPNPNNLDAKTIELFNLLGNKTFDTQNGVQEDDENIKAIKSSIKNKVDINGREPNQSSTLLMMAAAFNRPLATQILLKNGADPNAQNSYGQTALMFAAMHNNAVIARLLIKHGANTQIKANNGLTALDALNEMYGNNSNSDEFRQLLESKKK